MADDLVFRTAKKRREAVEFTLDDKTYSFNPPKIARAMLPVIQGDESEAKATLDWLKAGLSEDDYSHLISRLEDDDDDFDFEDIGNLAESLVEKIMTGRPTS
jgi:hypothetical protein